MFVTREQLIIASVEIEGGGYLLHPQTGNEHFTHETQAV